MINRRTLLKAGMAFGLGPALCAAKQSDWPQREVKVILPVAAGGANDLLARAVFTHVGKNLGVPFVIMNMPGGNATRGTIALMNSKNDGYTIGNLAYSALLLQPHMVQVPYMLSDFDMLGAVGEPLFGLGVETDSSIYKVRELVDLSKRRRVTVASNTVINVTCMIKLGSDTGGNIQWVPTSSQSQAIVLAAGGFTDCALQSAPELNAGIESGKIRLIASANKVRWPSHPDVETFIEQGFNTDVSVPFGYGTPSGVPMVIRKKLEEAILDAARSQDVLQTMNAIGVVPRPLDSAKLAEAFRNSAPVLEKILTDAGMKKSKDF